MASFLKSAPGTVWTSGYRNNHMAVSKSTNWGGSWSRDELSTQTGRAYTLAVDPSSGSTVYAGGYESSAPAIYRTTNGGTSWSKLSASGLAGYVHDILIDPVDTSIIYAATESGIYKSTNGGSSFSKISGSVSFTKCLYMDPGDNSTIYAATFGQGVWFTTNAGSTWQEMNAGLDEMDTNAISMNPDTWLFCGTDGRSVLRHDLGTGIGGSEGQGLHQTAITVSPCPSTGTATAAFRLEQGCHVTLSVYDMSGRVVDILLDGYMTHGNHSASWTAAGEAAGIYLFRLSTDDGDIATGRLVLLR